MSAPTSVAEAMSAPAAALRDYDSLWHAVDRFVRTGQHHLVVLDGDEQLVGVLDDHQLLVHGSTGGTDRPELARRTVGQLVRRMPPGRATAGQVRPGDPLGHAARVMARLAVDALPVVDGGRVVGVLTAADLRRGIAGPLAGASGGYA